MKRKGKRLFALLLAICTVLTGCSLDGFYADEVQTVSGNDIVEDPGISVSGNDLESVSGNSLASGEVYLNLETTGGGISLIYDSGETQTFQRTSESEVIILDGLNEVHTAYLNMGDLYHVDYEFFEGSIVDIIVSPESMYSVGTYSITTDAGGTLDSAQDCALNEVYTSQLSIDEGISYTISVSFKKSPFIDWRASTSSRQLYLDDFEVANIGKAYLGETAEEIVAMLNDSTLDMVSLQEFFDGTMLEGIDYDMLLEFIGTEYNDLSNLINKVVESKYSSVLEYLFSGISLYMSDVTNVTPSNFTFFSTWSKRCQVPTIKGGRSTISVHRLGVKSGNYREVGLCLLPGGGFHSGYNAGRVVKYSSGDTYRFTGIGTHNIPASNMLSILGYEYSNRQATTSDKDMYELSQIAMWCLLAFYNEGSTISSSVFRAAYAEYIVSSRMYLEGYTADEIHQELNDIKMYDDSLGTMKIPEWYTTYSTAWLAAKLYFEGIINYPTERLLHINEFYVWYFQKNGSWQPIATLKLPKEHKDDTTTIIGKGSLTINKVDDYNNPVPWCTFVVTNETQTAVVATLISGVDGSARIDVLPGTYHIREIGAPDGYVIDTNWYTAVINKDTSLSFAIDIINHNPPPPPREGSIEIHKVDDYGVKVPGCQFSVTNAETGEHMGTMTTDAAGNSVKVVPEGTYYVQETWCPPEYELDTTVYTAVITEGTNWYHKINAINRKGGTEVHIYKLKKGTNVVITDRRGSYATAFFHIIDASTGNVIAGINTPTPEYWTGRLEPGDYILREIVTPPGYIKAEDVYFTVPDIRGVYDVKMYDDYTKVRFRKVDAVTGAPLSNATFWVYELSPDGSPFEVIAEVTSGEDGWTPYIEQLEGKYLVREVQAPPGYIRGNDVYITVDKTAEDQEWAFPNDTLNLQIKKVNSVTGSPVSDAVLELYRAENVNEEDGSYTLGAFVESWTTTTEPHVLQGVEVDAWYVLKEVQTPAGFVGFGEKLFQMGHQHNEGCFLPPVVGEVWVKHTQGGTCPDCGYVGNGIQTYRTYCKACGAWYTEVYDYCSACKSSGWWHPSGEGTKFDYEDNGENLSIGTDGQFHGYHTDCPAATPGGVKCVSAEFVLDEDGMLSLVVDNTPTGDEETVIKVEVQKYGTEVSAPIADAHLEIWSVNDSNVKLEKKASWVSGTFGTNLDGSYKPFYTEDLAPGRYVLVETQSPAGYIKAADVYFTVQI